MKRFILITILSLIFLTMNAQKIQMIVSWDGDWEQIDKTETPYNTYVAIPEMLDNTYLILLDQPDDFDALESAMEAQIDLFVIGTYKEDGSQYLWGTEVSRNHIITKYKDKLRNRITYDEDGNIITEESYTETEALNKQVNLIVGHPNRILNNN